MKVGSAGRPSRPSFGIPHLYKKRPNKSVQTKGIDLDWRVFLIGYHVPTGCCERADGPDSVGSCGSVRDAPPVCSAAYSYDHSNCTYMVSPRSETRLKYTSETIFKERFCFSFLP